MGSGEESADDLRESAEAHADDNVFVAGALERWQELEKRCGPKLEQSFDDDLNISFLESVVFFNLEEHRKVNAT